jgi:hypothetical protein
MVILNPKIIKSVKTVINVRKFTRDEQDPRGDKRFISLGVDKVLHYAPWLNKARFSNASVFVRKGKIVWYEGTWEDGVWHDGIWKNGVWKNGTWKNGIWENGEWFNGTWLDGSWLGGIWDKGIIKGVKSQTPPKKIKGKNTNYATAMQNIYFIVPDM